MPKTAKLNGKAGKRKVSASPSWLQGRRLEDMRVVGIDPGQTDMISCAVMGDCKAVPAVFRCAFVNVNVFARNLMVALRLHSMITLLHLWQQSCPKVSDLSAFVQLLGQAVLPGGWLFQACKVEGGQDEGEPSLARGTQPAAVSEKCRHQKAAGACPAGHGSATQSAGTLSQSCSKEPAP